MSESEFKFPWPREVGIVLEILLGILLVAPFALIIYAHCKDWSNFAASIRRLCGATQAERMEKTSEAVVCPKIIKSVEESIESEKTNSTLSKVCDVFSKAGGKVWLAIESLLRRYPWIKTPVTKFRAARSSHPRFFNLLKLFLVIIAAVLVFADWLCIFVSGILKGPTKEHFYLEVGALVVIPFGALVFLLSIILPYLYWTRKSHRYEAKIAEKMAHHTCKTEKGCFDLNNGAEEVESSEEKVKWTNMHRKEEV